MWHILPLEMLDWCGEPTGTWRLTAVSDEWPARYVPLCECDHETIHGAMECEKARKHAREYAGR